MLCVKNSTFTSRCLKKLYATSLFICAIHGRLCMSAISSKEHRHKLIKLVMPRSCSGQHIKHRLSGVEAYVAVNPAMDWPRNIKINASINIYNVVSLSFPLGPKTAISMFLVINSFLLFLRKTLFPFTICSCTILLIIFRLFCLFFWL